MIASKFIVGALAAALPVAAGQALLNVYWGQLGGASDRLINYCTDPAIDIVTIGFVNVSPENAGESGYPGSNFASHCSSDVYSTSTGAKTQLLSNCAQIQEDIPKCQEAGTKILIGIGGDFIEGSNYTLSSVQKGLEFGEFMWNAFGPYNKSWDGPRPFDQGTLEHNSVDGFDFDIEHKFPDQTPWIEMIKYLRQQIQASEKPDMIITAAPQCPMSDEWFQMKDTLEGVAFDRLFIQYYNNRLSDCASLSDWATWLSNTPNKDAKIHIGRASDTQATGELGGYLPPEDFIAEFCDYSNQDYFGGVSLWDAYYGAVNVINGSKYYDLISAGLGSCNGGSGGDGTTAASTTTSSTSMAGGSDTTVDVTLTISPISDATSPTDAVKGAQNETATLLTDSPQATSTQTLTSTNTGTLTFTQINEDTKTATAGAADTTDAAGMLSGLTTSTVYTTVVHTTTSCPPAVGDCTTDLEVPVTETIVVSTSICPISDGSVASTSSIKAENPEETTSVDSTTTTYLTTTKTTTIYITRHKTTSTPLLMSSFEVVNSTPTPLLTSSFGVINSTPTSLLTSSSAVINSTVASTKPVDTSAGVTPSPNFVEVSGTGRIGLERGLLGVFLVGVLGNVMY